MKNIKISDFSLKHFERGSAGTKILDFTSNEFEEKINQELLRFDKISKGENVLEIKSNVVKVLDGYAPFCKLLIVKNFTSAKTGTLPIDISNHQYLRHGYSARRSSELPVFTRWFELPIPAPLAKYLVVVLYSKEQMDKEAKSEYDMKISNGGIESIGLEPPTSFDGDWGIVTILGQISPEEEPMKPETMLRNYMPLEYGGSGMSIPQKPIEPNHFDFDNEELYKIAMNTYDQKIIAYKEEKDRFFTTYQKSVDFWQNNAAVKL